jgi:membrane protease YdiL (CAAX protease family)
MMPEDPNDIMPILVGFLVIGVIVLILDFVLLIRWMLRQNQLQEEISTPAYPAGADPIPSSETGAGSADSIAFDLSSPASAAAEKGRREASEETWPQETSSSLPAPDRAYSHDPSPQGESPPFASKWSLVHPFLGVQIVILGANLLVAVPILLLLFISWAVGGKALYSLDFQKITTFAGILGLYLQNVLFVVVVAWYLKRYGTSLPEIGLRRPTKQQILLGLGLGLALFLVATGVEAGIENLLHRTLSPGMLKSLEKMTEAFSAGTLFQKMPNFWLKALLFVAGAVAAPIGEEVFFRGFLYNALKARINVPVAIVLSGLLFALIHFGPLAVVVIFPMGMLLAYVYERTNSLWVTILIHAVNNGLALGLVWIFPQLGK